MNPPRTPSTTSHSDPHGTPEKVDRVVEQLLGDAASPLAAPLSDLSREGMARLRLRWLEIPPAARHALVRAMAEEAEADIQRDYGRALLVAIDDPEAETRHAAVDGLSEEESAEFLDVLLSRIEYEPDDDVRAVEASALGRFALLAELQQLDGDDAARLRECLLRVFESDRSPEVRRRALESLGYLSDDAVSAFIRAAYESGEHEQMVSAVHAMGRQGADGWLPIVHEELTSGEPELRFEAVVAAGAIGSEGSVLLVIDALQDDDGEVRLAAVAALGAIGGRTAINALRRLAEDDDPAIADAAEDALQEASLTAMPLRPLI